MFKKKSFITLLVLLSYILSDKTVHSKEKSASGDLNKDQVRPKTILQDDKLFQDPSAFCEGCYGFVSEVRKLLNKWSREGGSMEDHIETAFLASCNTEKLKSYVLSPPKMERLCSGILAHYQDEAAVAFLGLYSKKKAPSKKEAVKEVCEKAIPACGEGVKSLSEVRKEEREKEKKSKKGDEKKENKKREEKKLKKEEEWKAENKKKKMNKEKKKEKASDEL